MFTSRSSELSLMGLIVLALLLSPLRSAGTAWSGNKQEKRNKVADELKDVKVRLVSITSQYEELKRQRTENLVLKERLEVDLGGLEATHARSAEALGRVRRELRQSESQYNEHTRRFTRGLIHFYRLKNRPYLAFLINSPDMAEFSRRYKYLQYVFQQDYEELDELLKIRRELTAKQMAMETASADLEALVQDKQSKTQELASAINREQELLQSLEAEKKQALERARKLQADLAWIDRKMKTLSSRPASKPTKPPKRLPAGLAVPSSFRGKAKPGRILWPVDTETEVQLVRAYGQSRSETGSLYFNPGIDIQVPAKAKVRAIEAGKVMHRGEMPNFGNVVFIDHGGDPDKIISIYGNLADILVPVGHDVARGEAIGVVGNAGTPDLSGALHFEIRKNAVHQDPLKWLRGGNRLSRRNR